jgi:hypothetical protein
MGRRRPRPSKRESRRLRESNFEKKLLLWLGGFAVGALVLVVLLFALGS